MSESKRRQAAAEKRRVAQETTKVIVKDWAQRGLLIEGGWQAARTVLGWEHLPADEQDTLRLAYYAGAQHLLGSVMGIMDDDREPTQGDLRMMSHIVQELDVWSRQMDETLDEPG